MMNIKTIDWQDFEEKSGTFFDISRDDFNHFEPKRKRATVICCDETIEYRLISVSERDSEREKR